MNRQKFETRTITLVGELQRQTLVNLVPHLPLDAEEPLEVVIREKVKVRGLDANARMWAGPLKDIAEQAYVDGRRFSAECWHEFYKREYLPDEFDPELCKEGYRKWEYSPAGDPVLVGSTTQLTRKGFAQYLEQIHAHGGNLGVLFHAPPNEARRAA